MGNLFSLYIADELVAQKLKLELNKSELITNLLRLYFEDNKVDTLKDLTKKVDETKENYQKLYEELLQKKKEEEEEAIIERGEFLKQKAKEEEIKKNKFNIFIEDCAVYGLDKEIAEMYFEDFCKFDIGVEDYLKLKKLID